MAFNGSGTFLRIYNWVNDKAANIKVRADRMDAEMDGMATGLSTCITKDGQTTITANLPMSNFKHTGVADGTNRTDYAALGQVQDGKLNWVDGGGTADAITATYSPAITTLVDGQICFVRATAANATTTPTFSPNGLTARTIVKNGNTALSAGDIAGDGHELALRYRLSDTKWELLNPAALLPPFTDSTALIKGSADATKLARFEVDGFTTGTTRVFTLPNYDGTMATLAGMEALTNKAISDSTISNSALTDSTTTIVDNSDATKKLAFECSGITTGTTRTLTVPNASGTIALTSDIPTGVTFGTPTATTSGTSVDYTGLPSGIRRITISFAGVSTNGTSIPIIQIGDSGGVETSGYSSATSGFSNAAAVAVVAQTTGFGLLTAGAATSDLHGSLTLTLLNSSTNLWAISGSLNRTDAAAYYGIAGSKALTATLDRIRLTTVGGADTFDAGSINILYQ